VHHNAVDVVASVQLAQEHHQVIADRAGHTSMSELESGLPGSQHAVLQHHRDPVHHVTVESVLDDNGPGGAKSAPTTGSVSCWPATRITGVRMSPLLVIIFIKPLDTVPSPMGLVENDFQ
jgi:hypothetical protein